jgi:hypothetical protein
MGKIWLNQAVGLQTLLSDKRYAEHMVNFNLENLLSVCQSLSTKQYGYILHLLDEKKWITIKKILSQQGLKDKPRVENKKLNEFFGK